MENVMGEWSDFFEDNPEWNPVNMGRHTEVRIKSVLADGELLELTDGRRLLVNPLFAPLSEKWAQGDQLQVFVGTELNDFELQVTKVENGEQVDANWGEPQP
jgi:hypothetical protein